MCEYLGYEVLKLQRTRIMNVNLDKLTIGQWRELTEKELEEINRMVATSSKTEEASVDKKKVKTQPSKKPARKPNDFNKKSASFRKNSPKSKRNTNNSSRNKRR
jgi:23S rRNA pseudouridine2604 synthase